MATAAPTPLVPNRTASLLDSKIKRTPGSAGAIVFGLALLGGGIYAVSKLVSDLEQVHISSSLPFVLTSGVAGTMTESGAGLQWTTIRALIAAWVLTLPISIALSGWLYWLFRHLFQ